MRVENMVSRFNIILHYIVYSLTDANAAKEYSHGIRVYNLMSEYGIDYDQISDENYKIEMI